jgi:hypothetical protein
VHLLTLGPLLGDRGSQADVVEPVLNRNERLELIIRSRFTYNSTGSLAPLENKNIFFNFEKRSCLQQCCSCILKVGSAPGLKPSQRSIYTIKKSCRRATKVRTNPN